MLLNVYSLLLHLGHLVLQYALTAKCSTSSLTSLQLSIPLETQVDTVPQQNIFCVLGRRTIRTRKPADGTAV